MKLDRATSILVIAVGLGLNTLNTSAQEKRFHFPLGLTYAAGIHDAVDKLDDLYTAAGFYFDQGTVIPFGLTFNPYFDIGRGFSIGADVGPSSLIVIDDSIFQDNSYDVSYIVPVGAHVRYTLFHDKTVSPYVRVGFKYPIVGGPNLDSSDPGAFGAVGVEFWRNKAVGLGVEVGYDASRIRVEGPDRATKSLTFPGFNVSIQAVF